MADQPIKLVLQKPPGYRDPKLPAAKPTPRPLPKNATLPPSFQPKKSRQRHCCRLFLCCFIIIFIIMILLAVLIGSLFYLLFDPKLPVFHLQSFKFPNFDITKKSDGTYLTSMLVARVEVRNPNDKIVYHFGESQVSMIAGDENEVDLGSTTLSKFNQEKKETKSLKLETRVKNEIIEDKIGSRILHQFTSKTLKVHLDVKTSVGVGFLGLNTGLLGIEVSCGGLKLKDIGGGEMPKCTIIILKLINIH